MDRINLGETVEEVEALVQTNSAINDYEPSLDEMFITLDNGKY